MPSEISTSGVPSPASASSHQNLDHKTGVTVIGSSKALGLETLFNDKKLSAVCYTNLGCKAQHITDRVPNMLCGLKNDYMVLAGGGNISTDESVEVCVQDIGLPNYSMKEN